jgi:hypothetical protein
LLSPDKLDVEAIYAAPFHNDRSSGPANGMERSFEEILRLLERLDRSPDGWIFRGSTRYLDGSLEPVCSEAALDLVERGMASDETLYVVAIGAITNVASALLLEPRLVGKIVVVWLGGNALFWPTAREFNLMQDVSGAQVLFDCGVPLVLLPCMGVVTHLHTSVPRTRGLRSGTRHDWGLFGRDRQGLSRLVNPGRNPHTVLPRGRAVGFLSWYSRRTVLVWRRHYHTRDLGSLCR